MKNSNHELSTPQLRALKILRSARSTEEVATGAGVSVTQLLDWLQQTQFRYMWEQEILLREEDQRLAILSLDSKALQVFEHAWSYEDGQIALKFLIARGILRPRPKRRQKPAA